MLNSIIGSTLNIGTFLICTAVSLSLGILTALLMCFKSKSSQSFCITLALLPAVVQIVIMLVNGNIGTGVAVAGAFSLVRFRSAPGNAKEISAIFLCMALGLATGMGYVAAAAVFFLIIAAVFIILNLTHFGEGSRHERNLKITIPENLDYEGIFDDLFEKYTKSHTLEKVKTVNMGTLFELNYMVVFKSSEIPKAFIDEIRTQNGNLNIICGRETVKDAL